jgi:acetamidase/formamidase
LNVVSVISRSWHKNPGYEIFLEKWKMLISTNHKPHKAQFALPAVQRIKKGDTIRVALREATKVSVPTSSTFHTVHDIGMTPNSTGCI